MVGPCAENRVGLGEAYTVLALLVYVHFHRDTRFSEGKVEENAVFDRDSLVFGGMEQKCGWSLASDLKFV
jgi:hypothetical protein